MAHAFLKVIDTVRVFQKCKKVPWPTRKVARQVLNDHRKPTGTTQTGKGVMNVYKCKWCKAWHVGHR
jgi:hypothetical protein